MYYFTTSTDPSIFLTFVTKHRLKRCYKSEMADSAVVFSVHKNAKLDKNSQNLLKLIVVIFSWFKTK